MTFKHSARGYTEVVIRLISMTALSAITSGAFAATYDWSYVYSSGFVISGTVEGVMNNGGITVADGSTVNFNGRTELGMFSSSSNNFTWSTADGFMSFDGAANNFALSDADYPEDQNWSIFVLNTPERTRFSSSFESETYSADRWSLAAAGAVPEPSTFALIGLGLFGMLRSKHRMNS